MESLITVQMYVPLSASLRGEKVSVCEVSVELCDTSEIEIVDGSGNCVSPLYHIYMGVLPALAMQVIE